ELGSIEFEARSQMNIVEARKLGDVEDTEERRGEGKEQKGKTPRTSLVMVTQVVEIEAP
ncbi:unnamed protein product, partial [Ilex paraguariensis]